MGANDAAEMLEVAKAECVRLERELAVERTRADEAEAEAARLRDWKSAASAVLSGVKVQGEPAVEFIEKRVLPAVPVEPRTPDHENGVE